jgi:hypothetical protein
MFGKSPRLSPLESRKQLLIAESELNRARMVQELSALKSDANAFVDRVKSFGFIGSSIAGLVSSLTAIRREEPTNGDGKSHWLRRIVKGAGLVTSVWRAFRPKRGEQEAE